MWHEGLKKWVGYGTILPIAYLVCYKFPIAAAKLYLDFAFKVYVGFIVGDVIAEHVVPMWFSKGK